MGVRYNLREYEQKDLPEVMSIWIRGQRETIRTVWNDNYNKKSLSAVAAVLAVLYLVHEGAFWLAAKWLLIWVVFFQLIFMILPEIFYSKKKLIIGGTRTEISKPSHYIAAFVAEPVAGGEVCGCIAIQVGFHYNRVRKDDTSIASVWMLAVSHKHRRQGIASLLMGKAEEYAAANGFRRLYLGTLNSESAGFYTKIGYNLEQRFRRFSPFFLTQSSVFWTPLKKPPALPGSENEFGGGADATAAADVFAGGRSGRDLDLATFLATRGRGSFRGGLGSRGGNRGSRGSNNRNNSNDDN